MQFFDWNVRIPTPLHFLQLYESAGLMGPKDLHGDEAMRILDRLVTSDQYLTLRTQFTADQIAALVLHKFKRSEKYLSPKWDSTVYEHITGFKERQITSMEEPTIQKITPRLPLAPMPS